jgi:hypothetical protein
MGNRGGDKQGETYDRKRGIGKYTSGKRPRSRRGDMDRGAGKTQRERHRRETNKVIEGERQSERERRGDAERGRRIGEIVSKRQKRYIDGENRGEEKSRRTAGEW